MTSNIEDAINSILAPAISSRGYFRPSIEQLFVSEKFFISIRYDPRERMSIRIGYHNQSVSPQLIRSRNIDEYLNGTFYSCAMETWSQGHPVMGIMSLNLADNVTFLTCGTGIQRF